MVTDACYNNNGAPNWCSSNTDSGQDDYGCDVHFDIQTAGPQSNGNGPDAVGMDGQAWTCEFDVLIFVVLGFGVLFRKCFGGLMEWIWHRWWRVRAV